MFDHVGDVDLQQLQQGLALVGVPAPTPLGELALGHGLDAVPDLPTPMIGIRQQSVAPEHARGQRRRAIGRPGLLLWPVTHVVGALEGAGISGDVEVQEPQAVVGHHPEGGELLDGLIRTFRDRLDPGRRPDPRIGSGHVPHAGGPQFVRTATQCVLEYIEGSIESPAQIRPINLARVHGLAPQPFRCGHVRDPPHPACGEVDGTLPSASTLSGVAGETAERTRTIKAAPDAVWAVIGDVTRMPDWSAELESVDLLAGDGRSVGSRFRGNNSAEARSWSMECVIDVYEDGRALEFHTENEKGETRTRWWYRLEPTADGTAVTEGFFRVAKLGRLRALAERNLLGDRTEYNIRNIDESLQRLAEVIESQA